MKHDHTFWKSAVWRSVVESSPLSLRLQELADYFRDSHETASARREDDRATMGVPRENRRYHSKDGQHLAGKGELVFEGEVLETPGWGGHNDH